MVRGMARTRLLRMATVLAQSEQESRQSGQLPDPAALEARLTAAISKPGDTSNVAQTEVSAAIGGGRDAVYAQPEHGVDAWEWLTAEDERVCIICNANEAIGAIKIGMPFPSGDMSPPAHPRCRCTTTPADASSVPGYAERRSAEPLRWFGWNRGQYTTTLEEEARLQGKGLAWETELRGRHGEWVHTDHRHETGQTPSEFRHPVTGEPMGKTEIGDTYETLFHNKFGAQLARTLQAEPYVRISGAGHGRQTPLDFELDHQYAGELKTLNLHAGSQKTAIKAAEADRKEKAARDGGMAPLLVVQVVDQSTGQVEVYSFPAFASKTVHAMEHIGSYSYSDAEFQAAHKGEEEEPEPGDTIIELIDGVPHISTYLGKGWIIKEAAWLHELRGPHGEWIRGSEPHESVASESVKPGDIIRVVSRQGYSYAVDAGKHKPSDSYVKVDSVQLAGPRGVWHTAKGTDETGRTRTVYLLKDGQIARIRKETPKPAPAPAPKPPTARHAEYSSGNEFAAALAANTYEMHLQHQEPLDAPPDWLGDPAAHASVPEGLRIGTASSRSNPSIPASEINREQIRTAVTHALAHQARYVPNLVARTWVDVKSEVVPGSTPLGNYVWSERAFHIINLTASVIGHDARDAQTRGNQTGWWTGADPEHDLADQLIAHEMGHNVQYAILNRGDWGPDSRGEEKVGQEDVWGAIAYTLGVDVPKASGISLDGKRRYSFTNELDQWVQANRDVISRKVGQYAAKNFLEFTAELWSEYTLKADPRPAARIWGEFAMNTLTARTRKLQSKPPPKYVWQHKGWRDAWEHEARGAHGEWIRGADTGHAFSVRQQRLREAAEPREREYLARESKSVSPESLEMARKIVQTKTITTPGSAAEEDWGPELTPNEHEILSVELARSLDSLPPAAREKFAQNFRVRAVNGWIGENGMDTPEETGVLGETGPYYRAGGLSHYVADPDAIPDYSHDVWELRVVRGLVSDPAHFDQMVRKAAHEHQFVASAGRSVRGYRGLRHVLTHEMGHAIFDEGTIDYGDMTQAGLGPGRNKMIDDFLAGLTGGVSVGLSPTGINFLAFEEIRQMGRYAASDPNEAMAEAWAVYKNGKPNDPGYGGGEALAKSITTLYKGLVFFSPCSGIPLHPDFPDKTAEQIAQDWKVSLTEGTITKELAWLHELRGPHGKWVHSLQTSSEIHQGDVVRAERRPDGYSYTVQGPESAIRDDHAFVRVQSIERGGPRSKYDVIHGVDSSGRNRFIYMQRNQDGLPLSHAVVKPPTLHAALAAQIERERLRALEEARAKKPLPTPAPKPEEQPWKNDSNFVHGWIYRGPGAKPLQHDHVRMDFADNGDGLRRGDVIRFNDVAGGKPDVPGKADVRGAALGADSARPDSHFLKIDDLDLEFDKNGRMKGVYARGTDELGRKVEVHTPRPNGVVSRVREADYRPVTGVPADEHGWEYVGTYDAEGPYSGGSEMGRLIDHPDLGTGRIVGMRDRFGDDPVNSGEPPASIDVQYRPNGETHTYPYVYDESDDGGFGRMFGLYGEDDENMDPNVAMGKSGLRRTSTRPDITPDVHRAEWSGPQYKALMEYIGPESNARISAYLRAHPDLKDPGPDAPADDTLSYKDAKRIDSLIAKYKITTPATLFRGLAMTPALEDKMKVGAVFSDPNFISMSSAPDIAQEFAHMRVTGDLGEHMNIVTPQGGREVVFRIHVPAGQHMAPGQPDLGEYILPRGSRFRVTANPKPGLYDVDVLPATKAMLSQEES